MINANSNKKWWIVWKCRNTCKTKMASNLRGNQWLKMKNLDLCKLTLCTWDLNMDTWLKVFHFFYNIFWTSALDCNSKIFLVEPSMNNYKVFQAIKPFYQKVYLCPKANTKLYFASWKVAWLYSSFAD